jgi:hypothetical protein
VLEILSSVGVIVGVTTAVVALVISIYRIAKRLENAIGVDKDGRTISDRMSRVEHQLWPNGGSSMADRVNEAAKTASENQAIANATAAEVRIIRDILVSIVEGRNGR